MRVAILPVGLAAALLVSACGGGHHSPHSPAAGTPPTSATPPAKAVTYPLGSTTEERGVTLALKRIVVPPNAPAELVMDIANGARRPYDLDLEFDASRIVVRQAGRRISSTAGPSFELTNGGHAQGFAVRLQGFRPDLPYTITAAVVADSGLKQAPPGWRRPLRFSWRFEPASVTASSTA